MAEGCGHTMKGRVTGAVVAVGLLALFLAGCGGGGTVAPTNTVTGQVVKIDDTGLVGATVSIGGVSGPTDGNGSYSLTDVPTGNQPVLVTATGYTLPGGALAANITTGTNVLPKIVMVAVGQVPIPPPAP
jgi:hypothetical protein